MKGKILAYSDVVSAGVITGANGQKYQFTLKNWISLGKSPKAAQNVLFDVLVNNALHVMQGA